MVTRALSVVHV